MPIELSKLKENLLSLNFHLELRFALEEVAVQIADLQRNQMLHGLRSTGKKIGKYKSKPYANKKFAQNQLAGHGYKDLFLEGPFQGGIFIDAQDAGLVIASDDPKTFSIVEREGEDIFGLMKESIKELTINYLDKQLTTQIINHIHGK